jgi:hypothetical protein
MKYIFLNPKTTIMKILITAVSLFFSLLGFSQSSEVVTNRTIIQLHKAGLGVGVLKSKIQSSSCNFDLSTEKLIELNKAGIPDEVITVMMAKGGTPSLPVSQENLINNAINLSSGIYYFDTTIKKYIEFDPSVLTNRKSGGLGNLLNSTVSGLFNSKERATLSGNEANLKFSTKKPTFIFVFDSTTSGFKNSNTFWGNVQSPNEFFLVKLKAVKKSREVVIGTTNNLNSDVGIEDKSKISFISKKIKKGVYEVTPTSDMEFGEYCFMFAASSMYGGETHKVYDFSLKK